MYAPKIMANNSNTALGVKITRNDENCETDGAPIPPYGPSPTWLHDLKRFVPLQLAFEEEVKEKTDVISDYESQVL